MVLEKERTKKEVKRLFLGEEKREDGD